MNPEGIRMLRDGELDLYISYLNDEQIADLRNDIPQLRVVDIIAMPIVFVAHTSNAVDNLSKAEVADIFAGRIQNWKEVGGEDAPISTYRLTSPMNVSGTAFMSLFHEVITDEFHHAL